MTNRQEQPLYVVDAFVGEGLSGNPAAVCPLPEWLPDETMQAIAREMDLPMTAFFVPQGDTYGLRCLLRRSNRICAVTRRWRRRRCSSTGLIRRGQQLTS